MGPLLTSVRCYLLKARKNFKNDALNGIIVTINDDYLNDPVLFVEKIKTLETCKC